MHTIIYYNILSYTIIYYHILLYTIKYCVGLFAFPESKYALNGDATLFPMGCY